MKKHFYRIAQPIATAIGIATVATNAMAEPFIDVTALVPDMDPIAALGLVLLTANLGLFVYRKACKVTSKS